jgi:hypothetical protein
MSFDLVDESTVTAPRQLERWEPSFRNPLLPQLPDVGGPPVVTMFRTWRCRACKALSTGVAGLCSPPAQCAKCGRR